MSEIILVDLPSKGENPHGWSLNPWKARAALNYKNLPYKTEWIEYPDLESTLTSRGVPKNDGSASYTDYSAPAANLPGVGWIMDSRKIGEALEKIQPMPKLHMDRGDVIDKTQATVLELFGHLRPEVMPRIPPMLLNPRSAEYFEETRGKRFGMSLTDLGKSDLSGETAWKNAEPSVKKLADILKEHPGNFVLGEEVSFADLIIGGMFVMLKLLDKNGDLYGRLVGLDDAFKRHCKAVEVFFEKDD